jgi:putative oxidoreductase
MLSAITMVHLPHGFFMNWYHLLVIGIAVALLVTGGGRWSVDRELAEKLAQERDRQGGASWQRT